MGKRGGGKEKTDQTRKGQLLVMDGRKRKTKTAITVTDVSQACSTTQLKLNN